MTKIKKFTKFEHILSHLIQLNRSINSLDKELRKIEHHIWNLESDMLQMKYTLSKLDSFNRMECQQNVTVQHISRLVAAHREKGNPFKETEGVGKDE